jgi:uncharacterized protein YigE (DUF2233 family)
MLRHGCFLFLGLLVATFLSSTPAAACGEDNQPACVRQVPECFVGDFGEPYCGFKNEYFCNYSPLQVEGWWNKTCAHRNKGAGLVCCTAVNYTDPYGGQSTPVTAGYFAQVDLNEAWIIVPNQDNPNWCASDPTYKNAVMSVRRWAGTGLYNARLMINANFFDPSRNPYEFSCNNAEGLAVSNKTVLSPDGPVHSSPTASLVFFTPEEVQKRGINAVISPNAYRQYGPMIQNAVSGFQLLKNGNFITQPGAIDPDLKRPRTAIGLINGNTLVLVVVNPGFDDSSKPGATTLEGLADYMKNTLHVMDALTLDGSGSSQFYYHDPDSGTTIASKASDTYCPGLFNSKPCYRPVPVFLGIQ